MSHASQSTQAKETLAEIPEQFLSFMRHNGLHPNPPPLRKQQTSMFRGLFVCVCMHIVEYHHARAESYSSLYPGSNPGSTGAAPYPSSNPGVAPYPGSNPGVAPYPGSNPGAAPYPVSTPGMAPYPSSNPGSAPYPSSKYPSAPAPYPP